MRRCASCTTVPHIPTPLSTTRNSTRPAELDRRIHSEADPLIVLLLTSTKSKPVEPKLKECVCTEVDSIIRCVGIPHLHFLISSDSLGSFAAHNAATTTSTTLTKETNGREKSTVLDREILIIYHYCFLFQNIADLEIEFYDIHVAFMSQ